MTQNIMLPFASIIRVFRLVILTLGSLLLGGKVQAELTWENTHLEFHPKPGEQEVVAHFKFLNSGKSTVKILSVHPACGCTTATLDKQDIAPNEKGQITATFKIGERTGLQQKTISVSTDDLEHPQTVLLMKTFIPRILELQPAFLYWAPDEELKPKTVVVTAGEEFPVKSITAKSSEPGVITKITPGRTAKDFLIEVAPTEAANHRQATISVVPEITGVPVAPFFINVRVH